MTATLWLRISSIVSLLFAAGHIAGGFQQWSPIGPHPVLTTMQSTHFDVMGMNRSFYDFYMGFGHSLSVAMIMQAILLWLLASLARAEPRRLRPIILTIALATLANAVVAWKFIFPVPMTFSIVLFVCLGVAYARAR